MTTVRADAEGGAESESDEGKDESAVSMVEELPSVAHHMDASSNFGHPGMGMGGLPGRSGLHNPDMGADAHMHRQGPQDGSMLLVGQGTWTIVNSF